MSRTGIVLLALVCAVGCQKQAAELPSQSSDDTAEAPARPQSLAEARKGFKTKLVRKVAAGQPLPEPPSGLFQKVKFESSIGELEGYLTPNPGDGKRHPAIVWITGGDCTTIDEGVWQDAPASNDQTAQQFRDAGIVTMYPTLRGGNANPGFREGYYGEVDDVVAAAEFLSKQDFVDPQRIYLGGHSSGATMALLGAEMSDRFRAVFCLSPLNDLREVSNEYLIDLFVVFDDKNPREFDLRTPGLWLHSIKVPTFVVSGGKNDGNLTELLLMERGSSNEHVKFLVIPRADHFNFVAPTNRLIAEKILRDDDADCNITLTERELAASTLE